MITVKAAFIKQLFAQKVLHGAQPFILTEKGMGYRSVLWSLDTRDWCMPKSDTIASKIEENAVSGDIILFHDLNDKRLPTPDALKRILPYLKENGYEFVTITEMIENEAA